jgi:hypothetical protein
MNTEIGKQKIGESLIGSYVIVRSINEGINAGFVREMDQTGIVLTEARRIWYHRPLDRSMSWYEGVAVSGLSKDSKVSVPVAVKAIIEDYSVTVCTEDARVSISEQPSHEQR